MREDVPLKEIVTIAEMARMCKLSRARFYELMNNGIFPKPFRNETGRPYYSRELQAHCLAVRRTNCGINGQPIMFYARRFDRSVPAATLSGECKRRPTTPPRSKHSTAQDGGSDAILATLRAGLVQLDVPAIPDATLRSTLAVCFPDGHAGIEAADVLAAVYRQIMRRD